MDKKHIKELEKSLQKCLRPLDEPYKIKHAIIVIDKIHILQSSEPIWTFGPVQSLTVNRFTTWKFCCLMHKTLHEGPAIALRHSVLYCQKLKLCAQYWSAKNDAMSPCIAWYCKVLHRKLLFHQAYMQFAGNLQLNYDELLLRDIDICFQLSLDLFDYLEDLLHLQRVIFANMEQNQITAASKKGKCRLASLVTIIAECNLLYQHSITILRLLHLQLSPDDISGFSKRFDEIFKELKLFYEHVHTIQLPWDDFLAIPKLPVMQPNLYTFTEIQQEPSAPMISDLE
ncbi:huntington interacting protein related 1-like [Lucilia sericata]|uniref:huntington interacting protein related 1-like n=1 Tax=Lucilia sericata TaxID=13632 RepID=UPI0018A86D24|nr:huntington interacting protein related 1-like [Lucilia sericata]